MTAAQLKPQGGDLVLRPDGRHVSVSRSTRLPVQEQPVVTQTTLDTCGDIQKHRVYQANVGVVWLDGGVGISAVALTYSLHCAPNAADYATSVVTHAQ